MNKVRVFLIIFILFAVIGLGIKWLVGVERIDAGYVGIRVNLVGGERGVADVEEVTGWVVYMPLLTQIHEFPTYMQVKDYNSFPVTTKDGAEFTIDPIFSYRVDNGKVPHIFRTYRRSLPELEEGYLQNVIMDSYRLAANQYISDSLISNRMLFENAVESHIREVLGKDGFIFEQLTSNIKAPQSLMDAIEAKNRATQEAIQAENKLRQAEAQAKQNVILAESEKKVNDLKTSSLTPLIIQQMFIEKWDGKLPVYGETPKIFKEVTK
ncbi:MAG: hypothetical protein MJZ19_04795 [Paludibacteraceae bacterium]|nr:hypothetical protein [Paludibacteraceae bacterium]